ncbi:TonB-dependent receptor [Elysia marginata]|uniref:TonB-dependent receptor n=1 Tax=Elysia marginata TaxID=1093978 RepID=A0AAV4FV46_9GAST|nr:TonB-dependent receptor [Elysia marginata]
MPLWAEFRSTPGSKISLMKEWESKMRAIVCKCIPENVTSIAGVPSWMLVLLNKVVEESKHKNLLELWKNAEVYFHGGISFDPYREQYYKLFPSERFKYYEVYNASEGFFAIQDRNDADDMLLMLDYGIFYEFIPMDTFREFTYNAIPLWEVEINKNYAIVITTNSGLWRYLLGDTVRFTSIKPHRVKITGRTKHFINAFGEEVIVENTDAAIMYACKESDCEVVEYTVAPIFMQGQKSGGHEWLIEFKKTPDDMLYFSKILDKSLKSLNSDYEAKSISAQQIGSKIKGYVLDASDEIPLFGVAVLIKGSEKSIGVTTDEEGRFEIDVPIGDNNLIFKYLGYKTHISTIKNYSGRTEEVIIKMKASLNKLNEIVVKPKQRRDEAVNTMSLTNSIAFDTELTERFASTFGDPSRMVTSFAGVTSANEQRNDIVVRGNTSQGLLWRLEGINIPNPNHFSSDGATGGGVSLLNPDLIKKSDFFLSAFLPEYGNATSGVFDITLREGNYKKTEGKVKLGFTGLELGFQGPFNKNDKSSFIFAYRYSIPQILNLLGIPVVPGAVPKYQDLTFKFTMPRLKWDKITLWGIGGISEIDLLEKNLKGTNRYGYTGTSKPNTNTYYNSKVAMVGLNHTHFFRNIHKVKTAFMLSYSGNSTDVYDIKDTREDRNFYNLESIQYKISAKSEYLGKIDNKTSYKTGLYIDILGTFMKEKIYRDQSSPKTYNTLRNIDQFGLVTAQPYAQVTHRTRSNFSLTGGLNLLYFSLTNNLGIDPRVNLSWNASESLTLNFGYGLHHKTQPLLSYYIEKPTKKSEMQPNGEITNRNLKLSRNQHLVFGTSWQVLNDLRIGADVYYQYLDNIPISKDSSFLNTESNGIRVGGQNPINPSVYSILNTSNRSFHLQVPYDLINAGTGRNYGVEITLDKSFSKGYYILFTSSFFDSKYKAIDGIERNTTQNLKYITNLSLGYEYGLIKRPRLDWVVNVDSKITLKGGQPYRGILKDESKQYVVYDDKNIYKNRLEPYKNVNLKIGSRINFPKTSHVLYVDFKNIFDFNNVFDYNWQVKNEKLIEQKVLQPPFLWVLTYKFIF